MIIKALQPAAVAIMPRDLDILRSLGEGRYLTAQAIEWLHWASWRDRWQRWAEQDVTTRPPYKACSWMYTRLRRFEQVGLVIKIRRPVNLGTTSFRRAHDVYALSERGAALLNDMGGQDVGMVSYEQARPRSFLTLAHSAEVGQVYAALRAKVATTRDLDFADWQGEMQLAKAYDRIPVRVGQPDGSTHTRTLPVQPDGTFRLVTPQMSVRCFVEVDRGRPVKTWREKILAYHAYTNSTALQHRYGTTWFMLLTITTDEAQRRKLMEATAQVLGAANDRYLFALEATIHPTTIGSQWRKIGQIYPTMQQLPGNRSVAGVRIEMANHVFIR